jgi:hypothetical protein
LTFFWFWSIVEVEGTEVKDDSVIGAPTFPSPALEVPAFDDPELEFFEADDHPLATKRGVSFFDVSADKTLSPSKLGIEDIWYRSSAISREDAVALASSRMSS